jgi:hypothetical protein
MPGGLFRMRGQATLFTSLETGGRAVVEFPWKGRGRSCRAEPRPEFQSSAFLWYKTRKCDGTNLGCATAVTQFYQNTLRFYTHASRPDVPGSN